MPLLVQAKIGKFATHERLVSMSRERVAIDDDDPAGECATGKRQRRRVQHNNIYPVGGEMLGCSRHHGELHFEGIEGIIDKDRDVDIAQWSHWADGRAAEQIGKAHALHPANSLSEPRQPGLNIAGNGCLEPHAFSIRGGPADSGDQRVMSGQMRKAAKVAIGGPQLLHAVLKTKSGDACVVDLRAGHAAFVDERPELFPVPG